MSGLIFFQTTKGERSGSIPNTCPLCHTKVFIPSTVATYGEPDRGQAVFHCPECHEYFIAYYDFTDPANVAFTKLAPSHFNSNPIPDSVQKLSTNFVSIYGQAQQARAQGLDQIAGPGYRKALEFFDEGLCQVID